ncbi:HTH luxR-type domain-containing protein [Citrobacter sedlakii]|uniref:helix-turn-helix transcriptional regulator n=1 Tax=Citrobacter sedlakii TaxID=67826 RepID=UPI00338C551E|nr:helix-turn-helix transcriptional regulator [Citrobacter sedlakii]
MKIKEIPDITHCVGCGLHCPTSDQKTIWAVLCENKKIIIWPEDNYFFSASLHHLVFRKYVCKLPRGVIFVDFCIENLPLFIDIAWLEKLKNFEMSIVLVTDRSMKSMARYWFNRRKEIIAILVAGNERASFMKDAEDILRGKKVKPKGIVEITENEMQVLRMFGSGHSTSFIAQKLNCSVKSVYNYQYSLCKKLGNLKRLEQLRLKHRVSW